MQKGKEGNKGAADLCGEVVGFGRGVVEVHVAAVEERRATDVGPPPRGSVRQASALRGVNRVGSARCGTQGGRGTQGSADGRM
jgi:hypothetical protein